MKADTQRQEGTGSIRERVAELTSPAKLNGEAVIGTAGPRLRRRLRHLAEHGLYWAGLASAFAWVKRLNAAKILMYHSVAASDEADLTDPQIIPTLLRKTCIMKRGCCALLHSRVVDCVETILRGDSFLTGLEGKLWLDSPLSRL